MRALPLLQIDSLDQTMILRRDRSIDAAEFVGAVTGLIATLPSSRHVINLCERRYHFLLALSVACIREQLTLLPPNQSPGTLDDLRSSYPDSSVLDDAAIEKALAAGTNRGTAIPSWSVDADRTIALAFTSGSTGAPQAHPKTWRMLTRNAELAAAEILGGAGTQLIATVPAQHVYGLETSAITTLVARCPVYDEKPFFAGDVRGALEALQAPRTLVTTPAHLRHLVESKTALPSLLHVVSATAPLDVELAEKIEAMWRTRVFEIYGCTEAGVMARRRTVDRKPWRTFTDGRMSMHDGAARYEAPQLPAPIPLQDIVESISSTEFNLLGRATDMIKVAGKRTSLQALTHQLLSIDGVTDAVVFLPAPDSRPAALVVALNVASFTILSRLSEKIDPVFLPRPLILMDKLPRNAVGKLVREDLMRALQDHSGTRQ